MRALAMLLGLCSAFFVFHELRLLVVTGFLQHARAGGQGADIGAFVFPFLALALAWSARKAWTRA